MQNSSEALRIFTTRREDPVAVWLRDQQSSVDTPGNQLPDRSCKTALQSMAARTAGPFGFRVERSGMGLSAARPRGFGDQTMPPQSAMRFL